jgi:hypothetical protein
VETVVVEDDTGKGVIFFETVLEASMAEDETVMELPGYDVDGKGVDRAMPVIYHWL